MVNESKARGEGGGFCRLKANHGNGDTFEANYRRLINAHYRRWLAGVWRGGVHYRRGRNQKFGPRRRPIARATPSANCSFRPSSLSLSLSFSLSPPRLLPLVFLSFFPLAVLSLLSLPNSFLPFSFFFVSFGGTSLPQYRVARFIAARGERERERERKTSTNRRLSRSCVARRRIDVRQINVQKTIPSFPSCCRV